MQWLKDISFLGKRNHPKEDLGAFSADEKVAFRKYNASRNIADTALLCHAPFSNLYFNTEGEIALCWKTFHHAVKYDGRLTLMEIWNHPEFLKIRNAVQSAKLDGPCAECRQQILSGNYVNVLAKAYDNPDVHPDFPVIMEFELSNRCNLACTMCNGLLSSKIRKERENLSPLQSPYGNQFVEELKAFIPYLKEARFNGGEPFLIKQYFDIWDAVLEIKPDLKMVIATNGTVLNEKVKAYLDKGNFHINLSMDGFSKATYEKIRVHGNHDVLMQNFEYFLDYCKTRKRTLCIMVNPLRDNWWELPDFVRFCNENNIHLWFNTIVKPAAQALWSLSSAELEKIYHQLSEIKFSGFPKTLTAIQQYNIRIYNNFLEQQIKPWWREAQLREAGHQDAIYNESSAEEKIQTIISHSNDAELLWLKFQNVKANIGEEQRYFFYKSILQASDAHILQSLLNDSAEKMTEQFFEHLQRI